MKNLLEVELMRPTLRLLRLASHLAKAEIAYYLAFGMGASRKAFVIETIHADRSMRAKWLVPGGAAKIDAANDLLGWRC